MTKEHQCSSCNDKECEAQTKSPEEQLLMSRMCEINHKIIVLSGKGGVGKSTVATNIAVSLALAGKKVGLLDIDIHGPSIPKLLNIEGKPVMGEANELIPISVGINLKVMSIGLLLQGRDEAVIWRGPMKYGVIKQFLTDVHWGKLDYLIVDSPPGTGDEPLAVVQLINNADGAILVTTPQEIAVQDVRRSITFCRQVSLPILGVVENMSGFQCPHCGNQADILGTGGGEKMAKAQKVPFLGSIPFDQNVVTSGDCGKPFIQADHPSSTTHAFNHIVRPLLKLDQANSCYFAEQYA